MPEYDPSDPDQVERATRADELRQLETREIVRTLLMTYEGRAFVWMLLQQAGLRRSSFAGEAPLTMAYQEGQRGVGLWAEEWVLTAAPEKHSIMRREAVQREQKYAEVA